MDLFNIADVKMASLIEKGVTPAVVLVNERLFKQYQMELLEKDLSQSHGVVRSPYNLRSYKGLQVIASQVISDVEVF